MTGQPASSTGSRAALGLAVACYLALTIGYLVSTPAFEAPDEGDHYRYAFFLAQNVSLPLIPGTAEGIGRMTIDEAAQAHHPPLYHGLLAATLLATGHRQTLDTRLRNPDFGDWTDPHAVPDSVHLMYQHGADERAPRSAGVGLLWLMRGWSVLFGLVGVVVTFCLGRLAFPGRPAVAGAAALLLAVTPKWTYLHGALSNDPAAAAFSHLVLLGAALALARGRLTPRGGLLLGLGAGLAVMCKLTGLFLVPVLVGVVCWIWWRAPERRGQTARAALLAGVALLLVTGWWFLRNVRLYGSPLAMDALSAAFRKILVGEGQAGEWIREHFLPDVFTSLLGHFGWWTLAPLPWLVQVGEVLVWLAVAGWALSALRSRMGSQRVERDGSAGPTTRPAVVALLVAASLLVFLMTLRYNLVIRGAFARYLFPALGAGFVLLAAGLVLLTEGWSRPMRRLLLGSSAVAAPAVAGWVLVEQFRPAFDPALARAPAHHVTFTEGMTADPDEPRIELLEPADGARLSEPPRLRWRAASDEAPPLYTVHVVTEAGRFLFASYGVGQVLITEPEWQVPDEAWAVIPPGATVAWRVRGVPDRVAGETADDMPASAAGTFTRMR